MLNDYKPGFSDVVLNEFPLEDDTILCLEGVEKTEIIYENITYAITNCKRDSFATSTTTAKLLFKVWIKLTNSWVK